MSTTLLKRQLDELTGLTEHHITTSIRQLLLIKSFKFLFRYGRDNSSQSVQ